MNSSNTSGVLRTAINVSKKLLQISIFHRYLSRVTTSVAMELLMEALTSRSNWNLEVSVFAGGRKTLEGRREPTTNSTHLRRRVIRESNPSQQRWEASAYPLLHPGSFHHAPPPPPNIVSIFVEIVTIGTVKLYLFLQHWCPSPRAKRQELWRRIFL